MSKRNEQVYQMAQDWLIWLKSRRFVGPPPQKNILVALAEKNKDKGEPPDGPMSAEIAAFNLAINALKAGYLVPFVAVYCDYRPKPVKTLAYELGIQPPAFYERAHEAATKVMSDSIKLVEMNRMIHKEVEGYVD